MNLSFLIIAEVDKKVTSYKMLSLSFFIEGCLCYKCELIPYAYVKPFMVKLETHTTCSVYLKN